jgi:2-oxoglutarate dehydrogenase E1 component
MDLIEQFHGPNQGYLLSLYERYLQDPQTVDASLRDLFDHWKPVEEEIRLLPEVGVEKVVAAVNLAYAIRTYGHMDAHLDPLGKPPRGDPSLAYSYYGLSENDLARLPAAIIGGPVSEHSASALEALRELRRIYCGTISYGYSHVRVPEERRWLLDSAESGLFRPPRQPINLQALLQRLTQVETLEHFLQRAFPGKTRFSIEGLDMLVPMLDEMIAEVASKDVCMVYLGMAHRGRINVLAHVLNMPYERIFAEFKDPRNGPSAWEAMGWTGDVVYHEGGNLAVKGGQEVKLIVRMPSNPSHLEHIDPVIEGMARAADSKVDQPGEPILYPNAALPVLIHGDASFAGQGVVFETLNLSHLPGYTTGGTIHIITNNQLGFTATPEELYSSLYTSDLAKGLRIPVIYVNADDPIGCIEAMRTAVSYRQQFHKDFLIEMVGYRRYGHNEGDEPAFTQPVMYREIQKHPSVRALLAEELVRQGSIPATLPQELYDRYFGNLQQIYQHLKPEEIVNGTLPTFSNGKSLSSPRRLTLDELRGLNQALLQFPQDFHLHPRLTRAMERRRKALDDPDQASVDWGLAETLAFASILVDGVPIRLAGEDVARGTFSQRHAVLYDVEDGHPFIPLQAIPQAKASFEIVNSPLTENATLGFEFGYNVVSPNRLVLWEAQYGDFINVAQAMVDEFVVSAQAKWSQRPSLVLLLPHGNEGQGPDHSSARMERFLQIAAGDELRIAIPTTAAQYFHILRLHAAQIKSRPVPLILFTPKGLLRHPLVTSKPAELVEGEWLPVLGDPRERAPRGKARRVLLCAGRIFADLLGSAEVPDVSDTAIIRVEQLYPFPTEDLRGQLAFYPDLDEVAWVQEEPENMGAWYYLRPLLEKILAGKASLEYIGRPPSTSPAEGSGALYAVNQKAIVARAFQSKKIGESSLKVGRGEKGNGR